MPPLVCLVTGTTGGIGRATALGLARTGATVLLVARDAARGEATRQELAQLSGNPALELYTADLSSQAAVHQLAQAVARRHAHLDVLVNNAGVFTTRWELTPEGLERTFATNHMGPFLLTRLLLPLLRAAPAGRIVNVASDFYRFARLDPQDPQGLAKQDAAGAYARSKLANVYFTLELARRLGASGPTVNCLHPGMVDSGIARDATGLVGLWSRFANQMPWVTTPAKGAETSIYLATSPAVAGVTGGYFVKSRQRPLAAFAQDPASGERLWQASEALATLSLPPV